MSTATRKRPYTIRFYRDDDGQYRWQRKAGNGYVVAASPHAYASKRRALANAETGNPDILACRIVDDMGGRMASVARPPEFTSPDAAERTLKIRRARGQRSLV